MRDQMLFYVSDEVTSLISLFARVLISGTTYFVKRGLDRGYLDFKSVQGRPIGVWVKTGVPP
jgi:hypothetical protein